MLAASAGGAVCILFTMFRYQKADPPMVINGALAGLVGITAGCAFVSDAAAIIIGGVCGIAMVFATELLESKKIDDPVGAFPVHGISGSIGTLAVGLFAQKDLTSATGKGLYGLFNGGGWELLGIQALGLVTVSLWGFGLTWIFLMVINKLTNVRVSRDEELIGLDVGIHGVPAYSQEHGFIELKHIKLDK
jgi:Amt family ammonium transporter